MTRNSKKKIMMTNNNNNNVENVEKCYSTELPPGFRFNPTNQELINYYLTKRVAEEPLPELNVIKEKTLYGKEAEEPSKMFAGKTDEFLYFFTQVSKKHENGSGKRMERKAGPGNGTWKIQGKFKVYGVDGETLIGYRKTFAFKNSQGFMHEKNDEMKISYIMHEYTLKNRAPSLSLSLSSLQQNQQTEWSVCKIRKKVTYKKKNGGHYDQAVSVMPKAKGKQTDSCKKRKKNGDDQASLDKSAVSTRKGTNKRAIRTSKKLAKVPHQPEQKPVHLGAELQLFSDYDNDSETTVSLSSYDSDQASLDHKSSVSSRKGNKRATRKSKKLAVVPHQPEQKPVHLGAEPQVSSDYDNDSERTVSDETTVPLSYTLVYEPGALGLSSIPQVDVDSPEHSQQSQSQYASSEDYNVAAQDDNQGVYNDDD